MEVFMLDLFAILSALLVVDSMTILQDSIHVDNRQRAKRHTPLDTSQICKAFGCKNGYCKEREIRNFRIVCECFPGYEGKLCDKLKCPYDCGQHGKCSRKGRVLFCKCDKNYYGARCDTYNAPLAISDSHSQVASKSFMDMFGKLLMGQTGTLKPKSTMLRIDNKNAWAKKQAKQNSHILFSNFHSHAEIDTSVQPDVCAPGFQCYHGNCDRDAMSYGMFQCLCKKNYTGLFCEKRCTLSCENSGTCMVMEDGHQFCSCPFNFTGHYCQTPITV